MPERNKRRSIAGLARQARSALERMITAGAESDSATAESERFAAVQTLEQLGGLWETASEAHTSAVCEAANNARDRLRAPLTGESLEDWDFGDHVQAAKEFNAVVNRVYPKA